jgi:predicted RNA-binding Zn ribbon-like protein
MTGENPLAAPQPGGRAPAPGRLALVQAFLNTHYDLASDDGGELLTRPAALRDWLAAQDLLAQRTRLTQRDLERALAVREGLRALAFANNEQLLDEEAVDALRRASAGASTEIRIDPDGPRFVRAPGAALDGAVGTLLAITATAMLEHSWPRLKACPGRNCGWAFYDHSRNLSARWCSMKVCGDREKARAYYHRHAMA